MANVGFRIFTKIHRPEKELIEEFRGMPVANIADCMNRMSVVDARIQKMSKGTLLGPAFTVKTRSGDNLMFHKALQMAQPGDVIVVDAHGDLTSAITGEIMMRTAIEKQVAGIIVDGAIRDVDTLKEMDLPIYAAGITPAGPYKDGPGEINVPVSIGSVVIRPGDILVGDGDGIVVIRPEDALELIEKTKKKQILEEKTMKEIAEGTRDSSWIDRGLTAKGCEIVEDYYK